MSGENDVPKDIFKYLAENSLKRFTNPFLGIYTVILLLYKWDRILNLYKEGSSFFIIDKELGIWFTLFNGLMELITIGMITIFILIVIYFFMALSKIVVTFFEHIVVPKINRTIMKNYIHKDDYDQMLKNLILKNEEIRSFKDQILKIGCDYSDKFNENKNLIEKINDLEYEKKQLISEKIDLQTDKENLKNKLKAFKEYRHLFEVANRLLEFKYCDKNYCMLVLIENFFLIEHLKLNDNNGHIPVDYDPRPLIESNTNIDIFEIGKILYNIHYEKKQKNEIMGLVKNIQFLEEHKLIRRDFYSDLYLALSEEGVAVMIFIFTNKEKLFVECFRNITKSDLSDQIKTFSAFLGNLTKMQEIMRGNNFNKI